MNGFKLLLGSKKACYASLVIAIATVMVFLGLMDGSDWVDFVQVIVVSYLGSEGLDSGLGKMGHVISFRRKSNNREPGVNDEEVQEVP